MTCKLWQISDAKQYYSCCCIGGAVFTWVSKGNGFCMTTLHNWINKITPLFHPVRSKAKTKHVFLTHFPKHQLCVFCAKFWLVHCNWLEWLHWVLIENCSLLMSNTNFMLKCNAIGHGHEEQGHEVQMSWVWSYWLTEATDVPLKWNCSQKESFLRQIFTPRILRLGRITALNWPQNNDLERI